VKKVITQPHSTEKKSEENKKIVAALQEKIKSKLDHLNYQKKAAQILQLWMKSPSKK
jgi:hypothetical protein